MVYMANCNNFEPKSDDGDDFLYGFDSMAHHPLICDVIGVGFINGIQILVGCLGVCLKLAVLFL